MWVSVHGERRRARESLGLGFGGERKRERRFSIWGSVLRDWVGLVWVLERRVV